MKILSIDQVREADAFTIRNEPVTSIDLMERAAGKVYKWIRKRVGKGRAVDVFCGTGNNGGDGLVVARLLFEAGHEVRIFVVRHSDRESDDFTLSMSRLRQSGWARIADIREGGPLPAIPGKNVVVDAIFGSGLTKPVEGLAAAVIRHINSSGAVVVSIDIPSGLFGDSPSDEKAGAIIRADFTLSFQFPKLAFMLAENDIFAGEWEVLPIGLHKDFISRVPVRDHFVTGADLAGKLKGRTKFSHKGHYGHALLIAGSYGKMGAAVLASQACLRSGVGLLHAHIPRHGYTILQTAVPEAMVSIDPEEEHFSRLPELSPYSAIGIGPGIGFAPQTRNNLKLLIQNTPVPLLFDADAITILGENRTWLSFVPKNSIYTPHPKEFERISGKARNDHHRIELQRGFCVKHGVYVVLKGAHTSVCGPDGTCWFNSTGNPGMATGGSGDVLTGLILGLAAQGYPPLTACLLGTYIHGLAGDLAAAKLGMEALIAGDIIKYLGKAFRKL